MPELRPTTLRLKTWLEETCAAVGEISMRVQYKGQDLVLPIVVGPGDGPTLLGRNWLYKLKLDWAEIFSECNVRAIRRGPGDLQELLDKYKEVFSPELGTSVLEEHFFSVDTPTFLATERKTVVLGA